MDYENVDDCNNEGDYII